MVIWKFSLNVVDRQSVTMPAGSEILTVQDQYDGLQLWAIVANPNAERELRTIEIVGTGNPMNDVNAEGFSRQYISTVQTRGGRLVWHIFELIQ